MSKPNDLAFPMHFGHGNGERGMTFRQWMVGQVAHAWCAESENGTEDDAYAANRICEVAYAIIKREAETVEEK